MVIVELTGMGLCPDDVVAVAREGARVSLTDAARERMEASAAVVARLAGGGEPAYGVSTGFGSLANVAIGPERREELQRALVRSHAAGIRAFWNPGKIVMRSPASPVAINPFRVARPA